MFPLPKINHCICKDTYIENLKNTIDEQERELRVCDAIIRIQKNMT